MVEMGGWGWQSVAICNAQQRPPAIGECLNVLICEISLIMCDWSPTEPAARLPAAPQYARFSTSLPSVQATAFTAASFVPHRSVFPIYVYVVSHLTFPRLTFLLCLAPTEKIIPWPLRQPCRTILAEMQSSANSSMQSIGASNP